METDYQKLYNNLTTLLQDICQFLSSDKMGCLSHRDKKLVESLITRAKVQLQEISKIEKLSPTEEYVDMDANKVPIEEEDDKKLDVYSSADDVHKNSGNVFKESIPYTGDVNKNPGNIIQVSCPYVDVPARKTSQNVKYGFISMKKKFLLFEKLRRVYAAIHNNWLLIYYTEKDNKPHCTFFLKHYEAKETEGAKSTSFELISTFDRKTYFFTALTPKDMVQWVVNINRCHDKAIIQGKDLDLDDSFSLEEDDGEHYDIIIPGTKNPSGDMDEEDDIYHEVGEMVWPSQNNSKTPQKATEDNIGPPLPGRPLKALTPVSGSDSSLASYDDIVKPPDQYVNGVSSDENGDETYDTFVNVKQTVKKISTALPMKSKETEDTNDRPQDKLISAASYDDIVKQPDQNENDASSDQNGDKTYNIFVNVKENVKKMSTALPMNSKETEDTNDRPKDKLKICQSNSPTIQKNLMELEEGFRNKFIHEITIKSNALLKPIKANKDKSPTSESKNFVIRQWVQDVDGAASEDDDDETYDTFVNVKQKMTKMSMRLPKINKESDEKITTSENIETMSIKDKIGIYQSNSPTSEKNIMEIEEGFRSKTHSFEHEITKQSNSPLTLSVSPEPTAESEDFKNSANDINKSPALASKKFKVDSEIGNNDSRSDLKVSETDSKSDDPKLGKWPGRLNPPVIKKVPTVPLKPKIKDKPFIGKRRLYGGISQVTDED